MAESTRLTHKEEQKPFFWSVEETDLSTRKGLDVGDPWTNVLCSLAVNESAIQSPAFIPRKELQDVLKEKLAEDFSTELWAQDVIRLQGRLVNVFLQANFTGPSFTKLLPSDKALQERKEVARELFGRPSETDCFDQTEWEAATKFWNMFPLGNPDDRVGESQSKVMSDKALERLSSELAIDGDILSDAVRGVGFLWAAIQLLSSAISILSDKKTLRPFDSNGHPLLLVSKWRIARLWQLSLSNATTEPSASLSRVFLGNCLATFELASVLPRQLPLFPVLDQPISSSQSPIESLDMLWRKDVMPVDMACTLCEALGPYYLAFLLVELSLGLSLFGRGDHALTVLEKAAELGRFSFKFDSALGIRREYQTRAFAQLAFRVVRSPSLNNDTIRSLADDGVDNGSRKAPDDVNLKALDADTDVLERPKLYKDENLKETSGNLSQLFSYRLKDEALTSALSPLEHVVISARCYALKMSSPSRDPLVQEQLRAIIERGLAASQRETPNWFIHSTHLWFRCKAEFDRTKTRDRAAFQMQALVDQFWEKRPLASERLKYCLQLSFPNRGVAALSLGRILMKMGLFMSAYEMFKESWLWEEASECLIAAGRKALALDLLEERLKIRATPRILCCLGDVKEDPSLYEQAWEISHKRYARAKRSLGKAAFLKGDIGAAAEHFEAALQISPLFENTWFTLGCCQMRLGNMEKALNSFSRVVCLTTEGTGEAWANLAAIHSTNKSWKQASTCISEAVKQARENWRVWDSYIKIHIQLNQLQEVILAIKNLLELGKKAEIKDWMFHYVSMASIASITAEPQTNETEADARMTIDLFESIIKTHISDRPEIFDAYAKIAVALDDSLKEYDLRLKQLRTVLASLPEAFDLESATKKWEPLLSTTLHDILLCHRRWSFVVSEADKRQAVILDLASCRRQTEELMKVLTSLKNRLIKAQFPSKKTLLNIADGIATMEESLMVNRDL